MVCARLEPSMMIHLAGAGIDQRERRPHSVEWCEASFGVNASRGAASFAVSMLMLIAFWFVCDDKVVTKRLESD